MISDLSPHLIFYIKALYRLILYCSFSSKIIHLSNDYPKLLDRPLLIYNIINIYLIRKINKINATLIF